MWGGFLPVSMPAGAASARECESASAFLIGYEITHTPEFMFLLHTERARNFFSRCFSAAPESIWYSPSLLRVKSRESRPLELLPAACIKELCSQTCY